MSAIDGATALCPHCRRPFGGIRYGLTFGPIVVRVIDAVRRAGPDGIEHNALFDLVYRDRRAKRSALKASIHIANDRLREVGVRITGMNGADNGRVYRITRCKAEIAA